MFAGDGATVKLDVHHHTVLKSDLTADDEDSGYVPASTININYIRECRARENISAMSGIKRRVCFCLCTGGLLGSWCL